MSSEPAVPGESGAVPDMAALAKVVALQRAEMDRLQNLAATSAVVERTKGALMALTGCSPESAHEELLQRAQAADRTLMEECWITLGALVPPSAHLPDETAPLPSDAASAVPASADSAAVGAQPSAGPLPGRARTSAADRADDAAVLAGLGRDLVRVKTPQDLARNLRERLAAPVGADAVMICRRLTSGGLELIGHAGIGDTMAGQWRHVPPLSGIAALEALTAREARWLEDVAEDSERYSLVDHAPDRWRSRVWLPVVTGGGADVVIGVLRDREGPFAPRTRELLRGVVRLCAGRLRAFDGRPEHAAEGPEDAVQPLFDALPGMTVLLTPLRSASGDVEDYRITAATSRTVDVIGRGGRELVGLRVLECWPTVAEEPLWQGWQSTLATGEPYVGEPFAQQELVAGRQELSTYSVRAARLGNGLMVTWLRHESSDRQELRLADLQRLGRLGWATWNLVTQEAAWSSQVFALLDRDPARGPVRLGELPDLALPEDGPVLARAVRELTTEGKPFDVSFRIGTASGMRHLRAVAEAVPDAAGTPVQVHGFVQDLTAQRSAELALVESERAILAQHGVLRAERTWRAGSSTRCCPCRDGRCNWRGCWWTSPICPPSPGSTSAATGSARSNCPTRTHCSWSATSPGTVSTRWPPWPSCASPPRA